ncbi:MAG: PQQ-binding-like beta-propeller repeat protein [Actinomycetota bacterium]|nr:PQQ-binding-like beta-propeller repeat protein [Actinomycetota bacterium]
MKRRAASVTIITAAILAITAGVLPHAEAASPWIYCKSVTATYWPVGSGADHCRTGFNPLEKQPPFISGGHMGTGDTDGPWLEWVTKISDLPSGVFDGAGLVADNGMLFVSGASTNSFLALNIATGLPVWRFSPDQRTDGYTAAYPASNAPVINDGIVYMTFSNGYLYALDEKTGRKIWSYRSNDQSPPGVAPPGVAADPLRKSNTGPFDPVRPAVKYTKPHGVTAYCNGRVQFMTLGGWVYSINAKTGGDVRKVYGDSPYFPGELKWWEYKIGGALKEENQSAGSSTRRFEAVPGLGCAHNEVVVYGSDGNIRFYNPKTLHQVAEFNRHEACLAAGWNCDMAIGAEDPKTGDFFVTTLDSRTIRLDWRTHTSKWERDYNAPLPFQSGTGDTAGMPVALPHHEQGFITEAVVGGPITLDVNREILWLNSQDGHVYALDVQDGHTEASCGCGLRPSDPEAPPLLSRTPLTPNKEPRTPYTRDGVGGPWDYNQQALGGVVLGGNVLYVPSWDNTITALDVRNAAAPKKVWQYEVTLDANFPYPPFGETFAKDYHEPFSDLDNKIFSGPVLINGHLYFAANNGSVYSFNLFKKVKTVKNLVVLGSGTVPFLPEWKQALGAFDNVWTPADWYKNQVGPSGYRLPKPAGIATVSTFILMSACAWWWLRRREETEALE